MKLKGENNSQMSKFRTVLKKLNGKASEAGAVGAVVVSDKKVKPSIIVDAETCKVGWSPEDLRKRRLMAFVKGIQVSGKGISNGIANGVNEFQMNVDTFDFENVTFDLCRKDQDGILMAVGMAHKMTEMENHIKIAYGVEEAGQYVLDIKYLGIPVPSSPFTIDIRNVNDGRAHAKNVVAFGKGLKKCVTGEITTLQLETKKVKQGEISVAADGINNIPIRVTDSKLGYTVQYLVNTAGTFFLRIKLDGKHIPGSPFLVKSEEKREDPRGTKDLFKKAVLVGSKERKNDLQP